MSNTKTDIRQLRSRDSLPRLTGAVNSQLDDIVRQVDHEVTPPLPLSSVGTDRVLHIGAITQTNSDTNLNRTIAPISNTIPIFTSGTVTLSATGAGSATPSTGSPISLGMVASQFLRIGVNIDSTGTLFLTSGTPAGSLAAATTPNVPGGMLSIGQVVARTNGSNNVQNVLESDIYQYSNGSSDGSDTTTNLDPSNRTILTGTSVLHPQLEIGAAATWTVNSGGSLYSITTLIVDGILINSGLVRVL